MLTVRLAELQRIRKYALQIRIASILLHRAAPVFPALWAIRPNLFLKFSNLRFEGRNPFCEVQARHFKFSRM